MMHTHNRTTHDHAHSEIEHTHFLRSVCLRPECAEYPTHDVHRGPDDERKLRRHG